MAYPEVPSIINFKEIESTLVLERRLIIERNEIKGEDLDYVRNIDDAKQILKFVETIHRSISELITKYPSLIINFSSEFINVKVFFSKDYVLDLAFLDDCLIPEKEKFLFGQDGGVSEKILNLHIAFFNEWKERKEKSHVETQDLLKSKFSIDIKPSDLSCDCSSCTSLYRTRLRENILDVAFDIVKATASTIEKEIESKSITETSYLFTDMQKETDKILHNIRYRLKKSAINRLDNQIKGKVKELFSYPSNLAIIQEKRLRPFLNEILHSMDLKEDLLTEEDYKKFFNQQNQNLWRNEKYIKREFKKIVQSYMLLKRKDISGTILQEYIGEFWTHSAVRNMKRKIIYHMGPTNSGKTYHAIQRLAEMKSGCYLAPLRLLAAELFDTLNSKGVVTNLLTGEEVVEQEGASHYSSTIEMARLTEFVECCVIDEIQMITDDQRGWAWTRALVNIYAEEIHLCGDPSALSLIQQIVDLCGDELEIKEYTRMTELNVEPSPISLGEMQKSDALIVFSRRNALRYKRDLERLNFKVSIVYGRLSPEVRREQARKFDQEETDIIVATDAISMGMNLPIRRIIFSTLTKFFNSEEHEITDSEIKQIAGRAGRFQRFPTGYVNCLTKVEDGTERVQEALSAELEQQKRCMVGPDLDIYSQVNGALEENGLPILRLSEFLRLFNTMTFQDPFFCVELKEMIELAEMVEDADEDHKLSQSEVFGFTCAPVNMGLPDHVEYYRLILNSYVQNISLSNEPTDHLSGDIDYLETSIKCVELYQWLSRHFNGKNFSFDEEELLKNKTLAIERLNTLLSNKIVATCSSCGVKLADTSKHNICEGCFKSRRFARGGTGGNKFSRKKSSNSKTSSRNTGKKKVERKRKRGFKK